MLHSALLLLCGVCVVFCTTADPLPEKVAAILSRAELRGTHWGIKVVTSKRSKLGALPTPLFEHNSDSFFVPASNKKLLTTATALRTFGTGYRFKTPILLATTRTAASSSSAAVEPNLVVLCGSGDPSLSLTAFAAAAETLAPKLGKGDNFTVIAVSPHG
jgi:D-alanyl-D-alanine carboxypeptidase/D-alanyl-D-alanine-endopeptidase (penicillin-binding protein 4)